MNTLFLVQSSIIDYVWPDVVPFIARAIDYNYDGLTEKEIYRKIKDDLAQCWVLRVLGKETLVVAITEVITTDNEQRRLKLTLVAGEKLEENIETVHNEIIKWAKKQGCTELEGGGREGWRKFAKMLGYKHVYTIYRKGI